MAARDPLESLKDCLRRKVEIKEDNGQIFLGTRSWPKDAKTKFLVKQPRDPVNGKYYTLEEVIFFVRNCRLAHRDYVFKAEARNIRPLHRADRRDINAFLSDSDLKSNGGTSTKLLPEKISEPPAKRPRLARNSVDNDVKSTSAVRASPRRQSGQFTLPVVPLKSSPESIHEELAKIQTNLQNLTKKFDSVISFLKDTFGLSPAQVQNICDGNSKASEYFEVIQSVRNNIAKSSQRTSSDVEGLLNSIRDKQCYQAVKHPERGWGVVKKDLLPVLAGNYSDGETSDIENRHHQVIENCLIRGGPFLKQSFSLLISRMLELNRAKSSDQEIEESCYNTMEKCLTIPLEDFRNMFDSLLSAAKTSSHTNDLERWISVSRMELKKLLQSLMMSYQSLRDIPNSPSSTILFQFPEPTLSMALNASKVTHSVLLDMYVRIGLAELRRILVSLIGAVEKTNTERAPEEVSESQEQILHNESSETIHSNGTNAVSERNGNASPEGAGVKCDQSFTEHGVPIKQEEVAHDSAGTENGESSLVLSDRELQDSAPSTSTGHSSHSLHVVVHETPQISVCSKETDQNKSVHLKEKSTSPKITSHIRRMSKPGSQIITDNRLYTMFKASLGNVLVSSFKKQIQEKIQASNSNTNWS